MHRNRHAEVFVGIFLACFCLLCILLVENAVGSGSKGGGGGGVGKRSTITKKKGPDRKQDSSPIKVGNVTTLYTRPTGLSRTGRVYKDVTIRRITKSHVMVEKNGRTSTIPRKSLDAQTRKRLPSDAEIEKQEQHHRDHLSRIRNDPEYHYQHAIRGKYGYENGQLFKLEKGKSAADGLTYDQYLALRKRGIKMPAGLPP